MLLPDDRLFHSCLGQSNKVNSLSDFEEIVWRDYINAADDFGIMRFSAMTLQAKFDRLANRPAKMVEKALETVLQVGLIQTFEHQNRVYCYQWDWQDWQHVTYPRRTAQPIPAGDQLAQCSLNTLWLFTMHAKGGKLEGGWRAPKDWTPDLLRSQSGVSPESVRSQSGVSPENSEENPDLLRLRAKDAYSVSRSVSHLPLAVSRSVSQPDGRSESGGVFELDVAFERLRDAYPGNRKQDSVIIRQNFIRAFTGLQNGQREALFQQMISALEKQKHSEEWKTAKYIPAFGKWIEESHWIRDHQTPADNNAAALAHLAEIDRRRAERGK